MTRELLHVGNDHSLTTLPSSATYAAALGDVHTRHWALERTEHQLVANDAVEAAQNGELRLPKKLILEKVSGNRFWNVKKAIF